MHSPKHSNLNQRCDGVMRRDVLRVGALTGLGLSLTDWFRLTASGQTKAEQPPRCILIWLDGGPSHLDMFDLKPDAPNEVRGPFDPIITNVKTIQISEHLPRIAKQMDKLAIIRSMTSNLGEHNFASHYLLTGYEPSQALRYPGIGPMVTHLSKGTKTLPPHIALARPNAMGGRGYLPATTEPFLIDGDPSKADFRVRDLERYTGIDTKRLNRRRDFLAVLDDFHRQVDDRAESAAGNADNSSNHSTDSSFEQAYRLILSPEAKAAFDLSKETRNTRQRYGNNALGQRCLLARRLVEAGSRFVTVTDRGWDTHDNLFNRLKEGYTGGTAGKLPKLDTAYAALIQDLADRRMLDDTLVILMGEFGRTPKLNTRGGRDHWPRAFSVVLAGGGVTGGQVIGKSDAHGESPADRPVTPADLATSVYQLMGIKASHELKTTDGRPVRVNQDGQFIKELLT